MSILARVMGIAIGAAVLWVIVAGHKQPTPTITGKQPIPYGSTDYALWKKDSDGAGTLVISDKSTNTVIATYVVDDDGVLHQSAEQGQSGKLEAEFTPTLYIGRWWLDAGPVAGLSSNGGPTVGVRVSPARLLYGSISPDGLVTDRAIGIGGSVYAPSRWVGTFWSRVGVGAWYCTPVRDGGPEGLVVGVCGSIR